MNNPNSAPQPSGSGIRRRKKQRRSVYLARFVLFAVIFALLMIISLALFFISQSFGINKGGSSGGQPDTLPPDSSQITGEPVDESDAAEASPEIIYTYEFTADLSAYEMYMEPENRDEYLILINTQSTLDESYIPQDLVDVADTRNDGRATQRLREYAARALEAMLIEARACGVTDVTVTSAYRSYAYQSSLFEARVAMYPSLSAEEAYARAATVVAIPGTSEHQSGLCADMHNIPTGADISFGNTASGKWLAENCFKFGFILRFPEDKTEITGISYEPWHFRYVGRYHASRMHETGLCLEEYFEYLSSQT